jgi:drug/metabolite transporter (DMT)-like permease
MPQATTASPLRGVLLTMAAVLVFACMDTATKFLAAHYNVPLIIAMRYLTNLGLLTLIQAPRHGWSLVSANRRGLVLLRSASLAICSLCAGLALQRMPVAETVSIIYLAPFGVLLLSKPVLGEEVSWLGWLAAVAGFAGILLIGRPGGGLDPWGLTFALITATLTVVYVLLSRVLAKSESTMALLFYSAVVGGVAFGVMLPWTFTGPTPGITDIVLFASIGALSLLGHTLFTSAYRQAPASLLAPVNYMHIAWAGGLGWLIFNHIPDAWSLAGMAIVALSGSGIALHTHFTRQAKTDPPLRRRPRRHDPSMRENNS